MSTPPNARIAWRSAAAIVSRDDRSSAATMPISGDDDCRASAQVASALAAFWSATIDVRPAPGEEERDLPADAAAAADDERDLPAELALGRHPLQLRLLERPVFDAERFASRQRDVVVEALERRRLLRPPRLRQRLKRGIALFERRGAGHHVNGVDEELRRDPRFTLVLAEAEHAERRDHDDRRVRVAQRAESRPARTIA